MSEIRRTSLIASVRLFGDLMPERRDLCEIFWDSELGAVRSKAPKSAYHASKRSEVTQFPKSTHGHPQKVSTSPHQNPISTPPNPQKVSPRCPYPLQALTLSLCHETSFFSTNSSSLQVSYLKLSRHLRCSRRLLM